MRMKKAWSACIIVNCQMPENQTENDPRQTVTSLRLTLCKPTKRIPGNKVGSFGQGSSSAK